MSGNLITEDTLSLPFLASVYDAAFMNARINARQMLQVSDCGPSSFPCYVIPSRENLRIQLLWIYVGYGSVLKNPYDDPWKFANEMNVQRPIVRASIREKDIAHFDRDISIQGGITAKSLVYSTKDFLKTLPGVYEEIERLNSNVDVSYLAGYTPPHEPGTYPWFPPRERKYFHGRSGWDVRQRSDSFRLSRVDDLEGSRRQDI